MARKRHRAEEIVAKLRQVDVLTAQGQPVAEAIRYGGSASYPVGILRGKPLSRPIA